MEMMEIINDKSPYMKMVDSLRNEWMPFINRYEMVLKELESDFSGIDIKPIV